CELYITHPDAKAAFRKLEEQKIGICRHLNTGAATLEWLRLPKKHACRIVQYHNGRTGSSPVLFEWMHERVDTFRKVFGPRIRELALRPALGGRSRSRASGGNARRALGVAGQRNKIALKRKLR